MIVLTSLIVAIVFISIGIFLLVRGKITIKPDERGHRTDGHVHSSLSLRTVRFIGLVFIIGGIFVLLGTFGLAEGGLPSMEP